MSGGTLEDVLTKLCLEGCTEDEAKIIVLQIARGLSVCQLLHIEVGVVVDPWLVSSFFTLSEFSIEILDPRIYWFISLGSP